MDRAQRTEDSIMDGARTAGRSIDMDGARTAGRSIDMDRAEKRAALERRAKRARAHGLPPVADWFGPADPDMCPGLDAPRTALAGVGLDAPWGREPRLVVLYSYASCPGDVEESRVWAGELGIAAGLWTAGYILDNARELALEWLAALERRAAMRRAARTARGINDRARAGKGAAA